MAKVVLFEANGEVNSSSPIVRQCLTPPPSLKALEAYLLEKGHDVSIVTQGEKSQDALTKEIIAHNPSIVGATASTCEFPLTARVIREVKKQKPKTITIVGGYHVSAYPQSLDPQHCPPGTDPIGIDFLVLGEGERTLARIADCEDKNTRYKIRSIDGVAYYNAVFRTLFAGHDRTERFRNLDRLPRIRWTDEELDQSDFDGLIHRPKGKEKGGKVVAILSMRGCSYGCDFCSTQKVYRGGTGSRSAKDLTDEIEELVRDRGVDMIVDYAPTANIMPERIHELCREIRKRGLEKTFSLYQLWRLQAPNGRAMITEEVVADLAATLACFKAGVGMEALTEDDAKFINKKHSLENLERTSEIFDRHGAILRGFYMITPETSPESIAGCQSSHALSLFDDLRVTYLTPFPGTPLYERAKDGLITQNWEDFTCEQPVLRSNHLNEGQLRKAKRSIIQNFLLNEQRKKRVAAKCDAFSDLADAFDYYNQNMRNEGFEVY